MNPKRALVFHQDKNGNGPVVYWVHRNFRVRHNWGLIRAREEGVRRRRPVVVLFCLIPGFLGATLRQFDFLLKGLKEMAADLQQEGVGRVFIVGDPQHEVPRFCQQLDPALVVTDFDPLSAKKRWVHALIQSETTAVEVVDSRNVVPAWLASDHREYMARTFRPKLHRQLQEFLEPFPVLPPHPYQLCQHMGVGMNELYASLQVDTRVGPVVGIEPGEHAAQRIFENFIRTRLPRYGQRNDPNQQVCSTLSPYLHFGMISSQAMVMNLLTEGMKGEAVDAFLDELLVRRELSDNFCHYTEDYDQVSCFAPWAQQTLHQHLSDSRPYLYSDDAFAQAETHDTLWNAAQQQLLQTGMMHGYMRMYWAKKILEWTETPERAMQVAIWLNDRYAIDGRESNGYAGIAWSIGGVHDRGWAERPIFGKIRYMNESGARRKFDVGQYIQTWTKKGQPSLFVGRG